MPSHTPASWCSYNIHLTKGRLRVHGETYRNVVLGFQYSFSCCRSSGLKSLPYVLACGLVEGAQMIIMPSMIGYVRMVWPGKGKRSTHRPQRMQSAPLIELQRVEFVLDKIAWSMMHVPFGENRTTFTAAECLLKVARYSTRGGLGALGAESCSSRVEGLMLGCTIHTYT